METIKTHHLIDKHNHEKSYGISKMETIFDQAEGKTTEAHRHDYYTVILVKYAVGTHIIDFKKYYSGICFVLLHMPAKSRTYF